VVGRQRALEHGERSLKQPGGIIVSAGCVENRGERGVVRRGVRMLTAKRGFADAGRVARGRLAVGWTTGGMREAADVVKHGRNVGMLRTECG
jgi:hypothetical protein